MALPAEARRRWQLDEGGTVEILDLGDALLVAPTGRGGLRRLLGDAVTRAGGYAKLASDASASDPDLA